MLAKQNDDELEMIEQARERDRAIPPHERLALELAVRAQIETGMRELASRGESAQDIALREEEARDREEDAALWRVLGPHLGG